MEETGAVSGMTEAQVQDALDKEIQVMAEKDFRRMTWGMDMKTVKSTEPGAPKSEEDSAMIYSRKVAGMDAALGYVFAENKLVRARYMFHQQHEKYDSYIADYNNLKSALEKQYGKAVKERAIWKNDLYRKIQSQWGIALGEGYVTFITLWETPNTDISLTLKGDNGKIDLWLEYKSKALAKLEQTE